GGERPDLRRPPRGAGRRLRRRRVRGRPSRPRVGGRAPGVVPRARTTRGGRPAPRAGGRGALAAARGAGAAVRGRAGGREGLRQALHDRRARRARRRLADRGRDGFDDVRSARRRAEERGVLIQLPEDVVAAPERSLEAPRETVPANAIPRGRMGLDIGPRTVEEFARTLSDAKTILWNGPMGVFELEPFSAGTRG